MRSWICLTAAIFCEVIGTSSMKLLIDYLPMAGHLFMYAMIGLSYYLLSFAIKKVPVGVAYAFWEGIGIVLITIISVLFFGEKIGLNNIIALGIMITGIICIKYGTQSYESKEKNKLLTDKIRVMP